MVSLNEQLLPEEVDVLARTGASALDVSAMFVVQDVFRAAAALRTRLEAGALAAEGLTWSSFTMLFCLWVWGPAETRELAERMGVTRDRLGRDRHARAARPRRAPRPRRRRAPAHGRAHREPASATFGQLFHASTPRSRWPAAVSAQHQRRRNSPRSCAHS